MLTKRIIPCLDVHAGRVVKGVNFVDIRDAGDPVEMAKMFNKSGADELVFLDITASAHERSIMADVVAKTAEEVFIPLTVGGGIRTVDDFRNMLKQGADKISVNSAALKTPELINEAAERFGSQCVVCRDRRQTAGGQIGLGRVSERRTGEHRPRSAGVGRRSRAPRCGRDTADQHGYRRHQRRLRPASSHVPWRISWVFRSSRRAARASSSHFKDVLTTGGADAVLVASIFHYGEYTVKDVKDYFVRENIPVRI